MNQLETILFQFRQPLLDSVIQTLAGHESLQIVGLVGSAKSLIFTQILPEYLRQERPADIHPFVFSCKNINFSEQIRSLEDNLRSDVLNVVIIDDFANQYASENFRPIWNNLWALRSRYKNQLAFIFLTSAILDYSLFGQFGYVLNENIVYLSPPELEEYRQFFLNQFPQAKVSQIDKLYQSSFGNYRLTKILLKDSLKNSLEELIEKPWLSPRCSILLDQLINDLSLYHNSLQFLASNNLALVLPQDMEVFKTLGLVDSKNNLIPIIANYLRRQLTDPYQEKINDYTFVSPLTDTEKKLFQSLSDQSNQIVSRDDLIRQVWGADKYLDIYDHSLDQLVYRLKQKIKSSHLRLHLKAQKGRGFILVV